MLTEREKEVLELIGKGLTNKEIAEKLAISIYTVENHNRHIFDKLAVNNRIQAFVSASQMNIL